MPERQIAAESHLQTNLSLLQRLRGGDTAALEIVMEQHAPRVYRVAYGITKVLEGADFYNKSSICSTSAQMLNEIKGNELAIGFLSMAWITVHSDTLDTSVKALKIAPAVGYYVGLHQAYIADKSYPLVTEAYIMSTDFSMNVSVGFISFMLSYDGQRIVFGVLYVICGQDGGIVQPSPVLQQPIG